MLITKALFGLSAKASARLGDRRLPFADPTCAYVRGRRAPRRPCRRATRRSAPPRGGALHLSEVAVRSARCPIAGRGVAVVAGREFRIERDRLAEEGPGVCCPRRRICGSARGRAGRPPTRRAVPAACAARAAARPRPAPARSPPATLAVISSCTAKMSLRSRS